MAEYIVTVKHGVNWEEVHNELIRDTSADSSVDSNIVPDREVEVKVLRPNSKRNTHYDLTDEEVAELRKDSRIEAVEKPDQYGYEIALKQDHNFQKNWSSDTGTQLANWGLVRHINETNIYGTSMDNPSQTYDYVLDGTGVDVVIMDTGIQADHPEWQDADGNSRLQQIDWYSEAGVSGTMPTNHYTDQMGHGTHVTGTVAGKTFGWAKNAKIYSMKVYLSGVVGGISISPDSNGNTAYDLLRLWHQNKGNNRPTVVNMSFAKGVYADTSGPKVIVGGFYEVDGIIHRGQNYNITLYNDLKNYGLLGGTIPYRSASDDAEVQSLIDAGIHVCIAAGNSAYKIDVPGGVDYDTKIYEGTFSNRTGELFLHRGASPFATDAFQIGALDNRSYNSTLDQKVSFSNCGPGVDIYAAGEAIISAVPNNQGEAYFPDANFKQEMYQGTSMASPQMCGMVALALQAYPDWTPKQMKSWFINNSKDRIYSSGSDNNYTQTNDINGGGKRVAYFPLHGDKPWGYSSS